MGTPTLRKLNDDEQKIYDKLLVQASRYRDADDNQKILLNLIACSVNNELEFTRDEIIWLSNQESNITHELYKAESIDVQSNLGQYIRAGKKKHIKSEKKQQEKYMLDILQTFKTTMDEYFIKRTMFAYDFKNQVKSRMGLIYGINKEQFRNIDNALSQLPSGLDYKEIIKGTNRYVYQYTNGTLWYEYRTLFENVIRAVRNKYDLIYEELPTNTWGNRNYVEMLEKNYPIFRELYIKQIRPLWD